MRRKRSNKAGKDQGREIRAVLRYARPDGLVATMSPSRLSNRKEASTLRRLQVKPSATEIGARVAAIHMKRPGRICLCTHRREDQGTWGLARNDARKVREIVHEADPEIIEEWMWNPTWAHGGICLHGETHKNVVKMTFAKGAALKDPSGLFSSSLDGNTRRAIEHPRRRQGRTISPLRDLQRRSWPPKDARS
jgi:hypothetical protein